jgi:hypothetical protein
MAKPLDPISGASCASHRAPSGVSMKDTIDAIPIVLLNQSHRTIDATFI